METSERPRPRWREWLCQAEVLLVLPCAVITAAWLSPLGGVTGHALIVAAFLAPGLIRGRVQRGFCYLVLAFGLMLAAPVPEAVAGTNKPPLLGVTVTFAFTSTDIVYPEPSVARACTAPVTWQPSFSQVMLKGCPTP